MIVDIDGNELNKFKFDIELKMQSDAAAFVEELLKQISKVKLNNETSKWLEQCQSWKKQYPVVLEEFKKDEGAVGGIW